MQFVWRALFCMVVISFSVLTIQSSYGYAHNSPYEQIAKGISLGNVVCMDNSVLIKEQSKHSVACVKPETAKKLIDRGWSLVETRVGLFEADMYTTRLPFSPSTKNSTQQIVEISNQT